jgi:hypothetical protein
MHKSRLIALLIGSGFVLAPTLTRAELLLYYSFDNFGNGPVANNTTIDNIVAGKPDGTFRSGTLGGSANFVAGGTVAGGNLGRSLQLTPLADGNQNLEAPNIDTAFTAIQLSITPSSAYTAMAWVNFASQSGDNMIFGQNGGVANGGRVLHHGSRNGNYHSGHWNDDLGPDQGVSIATGAGIWHHVAYTNEASGTQSIFVDGVQVATGGSNGTAGEMDTLQNILIGTSNNGGSFSGMLDEIKIYNETLTASQIQAASSVIPEPASFAMIALGAGAVGLLGRRRRA